MIELTTENTQKAVAKCRQLKPKVRFIKDYPKNGDEVLGYFDKAIQHFADKAHNTGILLNVKKQFLEVEKTL